MSALTEARKLRVGDVVVGSDEGRMVVRMAEPAGDDMVLQLVCLPSCEAPHAHKPFRSCGWVTFNREGS